LKITIHHNNSQTEAQLLSPSPPLSFFVTIYLEMGKLPFLI
jgi:hypothetical protein